MHLQVKKLKLHIFTKSLPCQKFLQGSYHYAPEKGDLLIPPQAAVF